MPGPGDDILIVPTTKSIGRAYAVMSKPIAAGDEILLMHSRDGKIYGYKPSQIFPSDSILLAPVKGDKRMVVGLTDYPDFIASGSWSTWAQSYCAVTTSPTGCTCQCAVYGPEKYNSGCTLTIPIRAYCNRQQFTFSVGASQWTAGNPPQLIGYGVGHSSWGDLGGGATGAGGTWTSTTELHKGDTFSITFWMTAELSGSVQYGEKVTMTITGINLWRE